MEFWTRLRAGNRWRRLIPSVTVPKRWKNWINSLVGEMITNFSVRMRSLGAPTALETRDSNKSMALLTDSCSAPCCCFACCQALAQIIRDTQQDTVISFFTGTVRWRRSWCCLTRDASFCQPVWEPLPFPSCQWLLVEPPEPRYGDPHWERGALCFLAYFLLWVRLLLVPRVDMFEWFANFKWKLLTQVPYDARQKVPDDWMTISWPISCLSTLLRKNECVQQLFERHS